jgi:hypothetical protein
MHKQLKGTRGSWLQAALVKILKIMQCLVRYTLKFYLQILKLPLNEQIQKPSAPTKKVQIDIVGDKKAWKIWLWKFLETLILKP